MGERVKKFLINLRSIGKSVKLRQKIEELESKNQESDKKIREMEKLFSLIAHDLRSPFNGFLGLTELLASEYGMSVAEQKENLKEMHKQANNVFDLLNNLLNWSRARMGQNSVSLINLNLKETVDNIINLLQMKACEKQISIINRVPANTIIHADADITEIVIRNLISNSLKFTNSGGIITISEITADNLVQVSVTDTGIGIKPESLKKLFSPEFYSTPGTNNEKGTGLGLLLCREMIEQQGGQISASSTVGKGAIITFTVKLTKPVEPVKTGE